MSSAGSAPPPAREPVTPDAVVAVVRLLLMVFAAARQAASSKPPLRPAKESNGSKPVARPTKESHGSNASIHPTKSPAKATAAGQPPIRRHASRTTLPHSARRTSVARPSRLQPVSSDHRSSPAQPRPASPARRSLSPPSSQSPSGTRHLAHTATLEPVCSGRAHTIGVDKAMIVNFKSVVNWDSRYLQLGNGLLVRMSKPRPIWQASAAQAECGQGWPRLAAAWSVVRRETRPPDGEA